MPQAAQRNLEPARASSQTRRVLIADDEKNIRRAFAQAVEPLGLVAETAAGGAEALARLEERAFALMLLDLRMPDCDGLHVLKEARRLRPALAVVVLTAHGTPALAAEAFERGAAGFAEKPFTPEEFRDVVRRAWAREEPDTEEPEVATSAATSATASTTASARPRAAARRAPRRVVVPVADPASQEVALRLAAAEAAAEAAGARGELVVVNVLTLPRQTPLDHVRRHEDERSRLQKLLLERARREVRGCDVGVRARALVARHAGGALLPLLEQERADHLVLPWTDAVPEPKDRISPLNTLGEATVRTLARRATCEVTLVKENRLRKTEHLAVLVGEGPNAPYAVRRAFAFARSAGIARLKLVSVRAAEGGAPAERAGPERAAQSDGEEAIRAAAAEAGVPESKYEAEGVVAGEGDWPRAAASAVAGCDLVCVGAPARAPMTETPFGRTPHEVGERLGEGVALLVARGPEPQQSAMGTWGRRFFGKMFGSLFSGAGSFHP